MSQLLRDVTQRPLDTELDTEYAGQIHAELLGRVFGAKSWVGRVFGNEYTPPPARFKDPRYVPITTPTAEEIRKMPFPSGTNSEYRVIAGKPQRYDEGPQRSQLHFDLLNGINSVGDRLDKMIARKKSPEFLEMPKERRDRLDWAIANHTKAHKALQDIHSDLTGRFQAASGDKPATGTFAAAGYPSDEYYGNDPRVPGTLSRVAETSRELKHYGKRAAAVIKMLKQKPPSGEIYHDVERPQLPPGAEG